LLAEARLLLSRGVREINIVAQDTSDYGKDIYGSAYGIADLLADLAALQGEFWLRLFYFYPGGITGSFLEAMRSSPKIARYIDMPLQHLHPETLRRMKRPHKEVNTGEAIAKLRLAIPGIALRTTFIVGFPGETAAEFKHLVDGAKALRFERMGAFMYSDEEGTPAAGMIPKVSARTSRSRIDRLMRAQAEIARSIAAAQVGSEKKVLIEAALDDGRYIGRSEADATDVDATVIVSAADALQVGEFAMVRITGCDTYDLFGEA
jgi:ribosomal protein S12 methylthiotransferase